ncbi:MAG: enoyl-CoA hydratase/isomerase family protein [Acidobacteria bacterium]|nr:enoyl-CoA hydratase/isomerase family protein [Acidobacteriota bacterium]
MDTVRTTRKRGVLLLQLGNPSGFPRLSRIVLAEIFSQFTSAATAPDIHAVVLTGTPRCFAAGAELSQVGALRALEALRFSALGQNLMDKIEQSPKPVVAAIRGYCLGGGLDLALACHLRVASTNAVFGHPGAGLGIITGWGGTQRLPGVLFPGARARALEMLSTARTVTATDAYAYGLVNRVVPPQKVLAVALALAHAAREMP